MKPSAFAIILFLFVSFTSCQYISGKRVNGNGVSGSQTRQVGTFSGVSASGNIDLIVSNGTSNELKIEGDQNLLEYIETDNDNGMVDVYTREGFNLRPKTKLRIYATAPSYNRLDVSGSGNIKSDGKISSSGTLHSSVSGSGNIELEVDAPKVEADISGSGSARLKGTTRDFSAHVSGSGDVHSFDLLSENAEINIAGSGNAELYASKTLDVEVAGAGDVKYKGNPTVKQSIAGSGSVKKVD